MSEFQYYEFDRPLGPADREQLRGISSRARISATSFVNHYEWGDFKGDPAVLMARWFDLHLYFANWGARRLMIRLPRSLVDRSSLDRFVQEVEGVEIKSVGSHLVVDILREDIDGEVWVEGEDDSVVLARLAPLRADIIGGDLRALYLLWLLAVEDGAYEPDETEPLAGIGPLSDALEALASFFGLDGDLLAAAAERVSDLPAPLSAQETRSTIAALSESDRNAWLQRLAAGEPHLAALFASFLAGRRDGVPRDAEPLRTVGQLRERSRALALERKRVEAERAAAERKRRAEIEERARRAELDAIARRGSSVWVEIETEIGRRNPKGYDRAAALLFGLKALASEGGATDDFLRRVASLRKRHDGKPRFIERLKDM